MTAAMLADRPKADGTIRSPSSAVRKRAAACLVVMAFAAFLLFNHLGQVRSAIWDEAYYLPSTARYHDGRIQFASHPPLGLMLIAAGDAVYGANARIDQRGMAAVKSIPTDALPPGYDYLGPRLAPALFGVIGAGLFFLLMCELTGSTGAGLLMSSLYLCDTALLGQFRAAHLDPFQISFTLAALLCVVRGLKTSSASSASGFGFFVACAALVRANGIMLAPMGLFLLWPILRDRRWRAPGRVMATTCCAGIAAILLVFLSNAWIAPHLPDPATEAGRKDMAFLPTDIVAAGGVSPGDPVAAMRLASAYARFIASDHAGMAHSDANASHPWQWLMGSGAITYRWDRRGDTVATIALLPNRAAWLISLTGVLVGVASLRRPRAAETGMLIVGWFATMGTLVILAHERVLYAYSYFPSLMIGYALVAVAWRSVGLNERFARVGLVLVTLAFLICAPLTFHWDVSEGYCRILLRDCGT